MAGSFHEYRERRTVVGDFPVVNRPLVWWRRDERRVVVVLRDRWRTRCEEMTRTNITKMRMRRDPTWTSGVLVLQIVRD
jgi:hypothetical protein